VCAQAVAGVITERSSGLPVRTATVLIVDANGKPRDAVRADSVGRYRIVAPSAGIFRLRFQGPGLGLVESPRLSLRAGVDESFDAVLALSPTQLPTVRVAGVREVSAPPGNPHKYDDFLARKALGFGHFITRADIEAKPQSETLSLFAQIPGIKLRSHGVSWYLQSQRCSGKSIPGLGTGLLGREPTGRNPSMSPLLFIDGAIVYDMEVLREIKPEQIEAIEVYQGGAQLPAAAKGNSCFAIFVWLRSAS
jgi:hypothetical protein